MIPFNKPYLAGKELDYIRQSHEVGNLSGDGDFTHKVNAWLENQTSTKKALLTPSYIFVSTVNEYRIV